MKYKNDNIYVVSWDIYKMGEFDTSEAIAFHSRKQAKNFNRKHLHNNGCVGAVAKLFPNAKIEAKNIAVPYAPGCTWFIPFHK